MHLVKPLRLSGLFRPLLARGQHQLATTILAGFDLDGTLRLEADIWRAMGRELGQNEAFDTGIPKSKGEVVVLGRAFPPSPPATSCDVRFSCSKVSKDLHVVGDRVFGAAGVTDALPFTEMPLDWTRAYGGPGYPKNPLGRGHQPIDGVQALPNVEAPNSAMLTRHDTPEVAGFAPISVRSSDRWKGSGTWDKRWQEKFFPGPPEDFDWNEFNTAPGDQQMDGFFEGNEPFQLVNMHPKRPVIDGTLPRFMARSFIRKRSDASGPLQEVNMRLETILFVPHEELVVLLYRGSIPIDTDDASDIGAMMFALDRHEAPRPLDHYETVLRDRTDRRTAHLHVLRDGQLLPDDVPLAKISMLAGQLEGREGIMEANMRRRAERELAETRAKLEASGVDPDSKGVPRELPPPLGPLSPEEIPVVVADLEAQVDVHRTNLESERMEAEAKLRSACEEAGLDWEEVKERERQKQGGPPAWKGDAELARLTSIAELGRNADNEFPEIETKLADPALKARFALAEEMMIEGYRRFSHFFPGAHRDHDGLQKNFLEAVASKDGVKHRDFTGADLSGLTLDGANLDDAFLECANLTKAKLSGAKLRRSVLVRSKLDGADLSQAEMGEVNLGDTSISDVVARGAMLAGAVFGKARLARVDLTGSNLVGVDWLDAKFEDVKFDEAFAHASKFVQNDLRGVSMRGAKLRDVLFIECNLSGVDLSGADLEGATFVNCKVDGANFSQSNMKNVRMIGTTTCKRALFVDCQMQRSNFRGVDTEGADLSQSDLSESDFSGAVLTGARLFRTVAKLVVFDKAGLDQAVLLSSNLLGASFRGASLNGADLRDTNLFQADFFKAAVDDKTNTFEANISRAFLYEWRPR